MPEKLLKYGPGVLLCFIIAALAWTFGKMLPIIGGPVFAILIGMVIAAVWPNWPKKQLIGSCFSLPEGVKFTSKKLLQLSIILLGFEMNLYRVIEVGSQSLWVMCFTLSAAFITAFVLGRLLKVGSKMTTLIGVGTAICGGSAIAATAPVIEADDESVAHAISTIFLFNILAVFLFPPLGRLLHLTDLGFGMWAGTAVNDTSSVVATGVAWSAAVGNTTALTLATIVKLTRTLMIVPITLVLATITLRSKAHDNHLSKEKSTESQHFSFVKIFPWFVLGFLLTSLLNTFLGIPAEISHSLTQLGKFIIVMAMSAIGLNTNLKKLLTNGLRPILLGLGCWFAVASTSLLVQHFMGLL